jgi:8-oxo-dGTP pyrophosphatase MutT (NUDIX family)
MGFIDHVRRCNNFVPGGYLPFTVDGAVVGSLRPAFAEALVDWPEVFRVSRSNVALAVDHPGLAERSHAVAGVLETLVRRGVLSHIHGERYPATPGRREEAKLLIDRAAAPYFGIRAFGQHMNGFVREGGSLRMWIGRRSADRVNFPGKLDNLVAGGLPYALSLEENLEKECMEEAGIPVSLACSAVPVGVVTYNALSSKGLKPDTLYCYDLELPADFTPSCNDGEVEEFYLWPVEKVLETVRDSDEFKLNCNLVIIDFLIRHGYIGPGERDYLELVSRLHPSPPF